MRKLLPVLALAVASLGCTEPDHAEATEAFRECLQRHGVEAESLSVRVDGNGQIESIELTILSEGDVAYEPAIRLACTDEVNSR